MAASRSARSTSSSRLEAFSDGVFAVAITLLALNLVVPRPPSDPHARFDLSAALRDQWPIYLAYALSFLTILIMWINHHTLFLMIRRVDHLFLLLNGLLLMVISAMPFATSLLAAYLLKPGNTEAQVVYSGMSLLMAIVYYAMWAYASRGDRLLGAEADRHLVESVTRQYRFGPAIYLAAFVLAFLNPVASLALCIVLALFFALPSTVTRALSL